MGKLILVVILLMVFSFDSYCQIPLPNRDTIKVDTTLIKCIFSEKNHQQNRIQTINENVLQHLLWVNKTKCIAVPSQPFNESDLIDTAKCNIRLKFVGKSTSLVFVVYEAGTMGGKETFCNIYKLEDDKIVSQLPIGIDNEVRSFKDLKRSIKRKNYYVLKTFS